MASKLNLNTIDTEIITKLVFSHIIISVVKERDVVVNNART